MWTSWSPFMSSNGRIKVGVKQRIFEFEFATFKQKDILRANIFVKHRIDQYTLIEQSAIL